MMQNAKCQNKRKINKHKKQQKKPHEKWLGYDLIDILIFGVLTPFSAIFQLYHGDQF